ncbi:hypothetical protein CEXT_262901 [Caerostris extrusa]|uniref:Uncharacterized protein n=1 Tax=Caerostris extrusa TaxID=172846 RepID=A0AAV4Q1U3_CAEEX|nr:hypothetical protein CEXT_262901 [Caerostris extrusa]
MTFCYLTLPKHNTKGIDQPMKQARTISLSIISRGFFPERLEGRRPGEEDGADPGTSSHPIKTGIRQRDIRFWGVRRKSGMHVLLTFFGKG